MSAVPELTELEQKAIARLKYSNESYAKHCLKTKTKNGGIVPVVYNRVQKYIDDQCEDQKRRRGFVRKIIVKGRQQTCSTAVAGRFFHAAQFEPGTNVFILSHEEKSTGVLFDKAKLFNDEVQKSHPGLAFGKEKLNKTELDFTNQSTYDVGTAGSGSTGRGLTIRLFHGSECAFWLTANIDEILTGVLQTVALMENTEIILESTCNGYNWWYYFVTQALDGEGVYEVIWIPWWWTEEYRLPLQPGEEFVCTDEETKLLIKYGSEGLTDIEQLNWRRAKIAEFDVNGNGLSKFMQEYPCSVMEGFQASGDPFFPTDLVELALATHVDEDGIAPRILGVDSAGNSANADRTVLQKREGRIMHEPEIHKKMTVDVLADICKNKVDAGEIDHICIDMAYGHGVVDILRRDGYSEFITGVHFGQGATNVVFLNKRAEIYHALLEWLKDGPCEIRWTDDKQKMAIQADFGMMPQPETVTGSGKIKMVDKKVLKEKFKRSPDITDAGCLTFAHPVRAKGSRRPETQHTATTRGGKSPLSTRNRVAEMSEQQTGTSTAQPPGAPMKHIRQAPRRLH